MPRRTTHQQIAEQRAEASPAAELTPEICSIGEVIARYPGQWIVMRVTGYDEDGSPADGEIVARAQAFADASRMLTECLFGPVPGRYHLFREQRHLLPGDELRKRIADLIAQGDPPGRWPGLR
jgi:hypothetical protein